MSSLILLADDLTGALDTSAELVGQFGPLQVFWSASSIAPTQSSFAIDSGTRELSPERAFAVVGEFATMLVGATVAYKKIDSLLRGPWVAELDACLRLGAWDACIVAPAFVHQGRRTINGQQYARAADGGWSAVGKKIVEQLRERKLEARQSSPSARVQAGITVFDAETEGDLDRVVQAGRNYPGRLLWCGSGGLASALARGTGLWAPDRLKRPVLGIFGSDHRTTQVQLAACEPVVIRSHDIAADLGRIKQALAEGVAFVKLEAPTASRTDIAEHFAREIATLCRSVDPPGCLIVAGGETLKAQATAVGARALRVLGRLEPGIPKSVVEGGPWSGVEVVSKSGAFGTADVLWKLLKQNGLI
ncbi:MAG TPA: four-carbon acid sugar kinase family protein [Bradyrhizobium sp.]|uniref:four-carbon acid sugar kinase family protein n=1 Tax=Bradyrhizobium sp. TaxID=376 RepID=UPI002D7EE9D2|nr:four-carbon acid sugar kinase family protein [Bradyrhizobium sp.]HET7888663.1 four-carbon acid sugar kinase family protein [Bradyrhizobium sp.]